MFHYLVVTPWGNQWITCWLWELPYNSLKEIVKPFTWFFLKLIKAKKDSIKRKEIHELICESRGSNQNLKRISVQCVCCNSWGNMRTCLDNNQNVLQKIIVLDKVKHRMVTQPLTITVRWTTYSQERGQAFQFCKYYYNR